MPRLTLAALTAILAVAVFANGGSDRPIWHYCAASLGLVGLLYGAASCRTHRRIELAGSLAGLLAFTLALCILQVIPLPASLLGILSPSSLELYRAAAQASASTGFYSISVEPSATIEATLELLAAIAVLALISDLSAHESQPRRRLAMPLVAIALLEAILGVLQAAAGSKIGGSTGTYQNHNHFAGLLEMSVPFAATFGYAAWRRVARRQGVAWLSISQASAWLACGTVMLLAVAASLSRMGFVATLAGLFVAAAAVLLRERREQGRQAWIPLVAVAAIVLTLAALLPSITLIQRFAHGATPGDISSDARFGIWRDTLRLIAAYPVAGCGFGAFQSAYMRYQTVAPLLTVNFAHNDYLQLLAELGVPGFLTLLAAAAIVWHKLWRNLNRGRDVYLYAACLGALAAIALHSLVDFNLYKPANAMVVAWIAGIATGESRAPLLKHD